jgi:lipooligosaccharide transport system permease protein
MSVLAPIATQFDYWSIAYRRTWKGTIISSFLNPVLFLAAMGSGLGSYVNHGRAATALGGLTYVDYLAPALLVATAMQVSVGESTYPVMGKLKWNLVFYAMAATPLRPREIALGQLVFTAFRVFTTSLVFFAVIAAFGTLHSPLALLCIAVAVGIGLSFAGVITAFAATVDTDSAFALIFRLAVMPMFLLSGAFFPVQRLPDWIEWLAYVTPLWHGVDMAREFAAGSVDWWGAAGHTAYLLLWVGGGAVLAVRALDKRLGS